MTDPYLERMNASIEEYVLLERALCDCDPICTCDWDDMEER